MESQMNALNSIVGETMVLQDNATHNFIADRSNAEVAPAASSSRVPAIGPKYIINSSRPAPRSSVSRAATFDSFPEITKLSTSASGTSDQMLAQNLR